METRNDDNALENYFFELLFKKDMTRHALKEIYEVLIKENDEIEDHLEKAITDESAGTYIDFGNLKKSVSNTVKLFPNILKYFHGKYEVLEGLGNKDRLYIGKLFFGSEFPGIEMIDGYLESFVSKNIRTLRSDNLEKKGLVFHVIFSIVENVLNVQDEAFTQFLMNQHKETIEIDLLFIIEKALKLFETNVRKILLSFRNIAESIHSNDFLTDGELQQFKNEVILLSDAIIEDFKNNTLISEDIKKFEKMREDFKKMIRIK